MGRTPRAELPTFAPPSEGDVKRARAAIGLDRDLSGAEKSIALWVLRHLNHKTGQCFPSIGRLCEVSDLSRATVGRALATLHRRSLIHTLRHAGRNGSNLYCPNWDTLRGHEAALNARFNLNAWKHRPGFDPGGDERRPRGSEQSNRILAGARRLAVSIPRSRTSAEVASSSAERRWTRELQVAVGADERLHAAILDLITPDLQAEATAAEQRRRGAGLALILDRARAAGLIPTAAREATELTMPVRSLALRPGDQS